MLNRRRNTRRREPGPLRRWFGSLPALAMLPWRRIAVGALVAGGVGACVAGLVAFLDQPIRDVEVAGSLQHIAPLDVERAVRGQLEGAGLVGVRLGAVRLAVRSLPWVDTVSIERRWPHGLRVRVGEQRAVAYWNGTGLVNAHGELFRPDARFAAPDLARLAGPEGSAGEVVARYLEVGNRLAAAGMRLVSVQLDRRGAWTLSLDNGVEVRIGRRQVDERIARFTDTALRLVAQRAHDIEYVDLRYSNGFAVGWRTAGSASHAAEDGKAHGQA